MASKKKHTADKKFLKVIPDGLDQLALAAELAKLPEIYDLPAKWKNMAETMATPKTAPVFHICADDLLRVLRK